MAKKINEISLLAEQAKEQTIKILAKEYEKTKSGFTLNALYFMLKNLCTSNPFTVVNPKLLKKLAHNISESTLRKLFTYSQGLGDDVFAQILNWELVSRGPESSL